MTEPRMAYVIDDDTVVGASMTFFLKASGFATLAYVDGRAFVADLTRLAPGCVLLDIRMPGFDGFDVLAAMGDRIAVLPVIVMTGHGDVATAVRAMKQGASDFLEKPFEEDLLLGTVDRVLASLDDHLVAMTAQDEARAMLERLTQREEDVLRGLIAGRSNKVLAYELGLSVRTVEMHRASMMDRLGVRTLPDALRIASRAGTMALPGGPVPAVRAACH